MAAAMRVRMRASISAFFACRAWACAASSLAFAVAELRVVFPVAPAPAVRPEALAPLAAEAGRCLRPKPSNSQSGLEEGGGEGGVYGLERGEAPGAGECGSDFAGWRRARSAS